MIIKTFSRTSPQMRPIIHYIADKEKTENNPVRVYRNVPSMDLDCIANAFEDNLQFQTRQNKLTAYHDILSFHPQDRARLSNNTIHDLVQQYIHRRAPRSLWFGQLHTDQKHLHFHLLLSGNEYQSRRASRMDRSAFYQLRVDLEQYQQEHFPELTHSLHYDKMRSYPLHLLYSRLRPIYEQAHSKTEFWTEAQIGLKNRALVDPKTRTITYLNRSYSLADIGIDLSIFDRLEALQQIREQSKELSKHLSKERERSF